MDVLRTRDGTGSPDHGSAGQRFWPGRVGSRVSVSDPVLIIDPVLRFNMYIYRGIVSTESQSRQTNIRGFGSVPVTALLVYLRVTGRQSEGSIVRGFDNLVLTLTLTLTLTNSNPGPIYSTYMTVGLSNPRINGPSDYRYITLISFRARNNYLLTCSLSL